MATDPPLLRATEQGLLLAVRVQPRSQPAGLAGLRGGRLLVRLAAAPVDGSANRALAALLAKEFGLPKSAVSLVAGATSREKTVFLAGADEARVQARLAALGEV